MARKPVLGIGLCLLAAALPGCQSTSPRKQNPTPISWNNRPQKGQLTTGGNPMPATANAPQDTGRFPMVSGGNPTPLPPPPPRSPEMQPVNAVPVGFERPSPVPGASNPTPSGGGPILVPDPPRNNGSPQSGGPDLVIPPAPPMPPGYNNNVPGLN